MKNNTHVQERLRLLIAEDEKNIRDLLVELLSDEDREIVVVHNGVEAVHQLRENFYDLLITDLMMPELDGLEVLHQAKKLYPQILVMIITGYASLETAIQAIKEGAYDYLRKPFRLEELKISVDNACEKIRLTKEKRLLIEHLKEAYGHAKNDKTQKKMHDEQKPGANAGYLSMDWVPPSYFQTGTISTSKILNELERLVSLFQQGLIDKEEFQPLKQKLLSCL